MSGIKATAIVNPAQYKGLQRVLDTMKPAAQTRFIKRAIREAFRPAFLMMRRAAPKKTGKLRRSIKTTINRSRQTYGWSARLGPGFRGSERTRARHAHLIELGTRGGQYTTSGRFTYPAGNDLIRTKTIDRKGIRGVGYVAKTKAAHEPKIQKRITLKLEEAVLAAWRGKPKT